MTNFIDLNLKAANKAAMTEALLAARCIVTGKQIGRASCRERVLRLV